MSPGRGPCRGAADCRLHPRHRADLQQELPALPRPEEAGGGPGPASPGQGHGRWRQRSGDRPGQERREPADPLRRRARRGQPRCPPRGPASPCPRRRSVSSAPGSTRGPNGPEPPRSGRAPATTGRSGPRRPPLPVVKDLQWPRNAIDRFVLARLEKEGLSPSPEADRATLIRRLSLDLIGLPPTPAEVDAFLADRRPDAYERLVDRLLASPHYGERWGRHWLDLARYADTNGYEKDRERSIWPYRDWVIHALNRDMPFDRFTIEQLAGDLLPGATPDQRIATGFHRNTMINEEGGIDVEEFRFDATVDRVNTTGTVWLGLTVGCAQCHDHKYDPITQREYYRLFAFLNNADEPEIDVPDPDIARRRAEIEARIAGLEAGLEHVIPPGDRPAWRPGWPDWEKSLHPVRWTVLKPDRLVSRKHATLTVQPDGSVLATGDKPNNDVYEIDLRTGLKGITAVRLEVLPDPSLPDGGPGRAPLVPGRRLPAHRVPGGRRAARSSREAASPLTFRRAHRGLRGQGAFRGAGHRRRSPTPAGASRARSASRIAAVFELKETTGGDGRHATLHVTMHQEFIHQMTIGRFRLSATTDRPPVSASGLPAEVEEILLDPRREPIRRSGRDAQEPLPVGRSRAGRGRARRSTSLRAVAAACSRRRWSCRSDRPSTRGRPSVHKRGEFLKLGEPVEPGVPAVAPPASRGRSREPARRWPGGWSTPDNPLVGRVVMNQLWQTYFGRGPGDARPRTSAPRATAHPSRAARLAGHRVHRPGLEPEGDAPADRHDRPTYRQSSHADARAAGARPEEPAPGPRAAVPARGRDRPRHRPGRQRPADAEARRARASSRRSPRACTVAGLRR